MLAPFSCVCLVVLACWPDHAPHPLRVLGLHLPRHWSRVRALHRGTFRQLLACTRRDPANLVPAADELPVNTVASASSRIAMKRKLDESLSCWPASWCCCSLGLEGLALEGQNNGDQRRRAASMVICFFACLFGVCFMLVETIPPPAPRAGTTRAAAPPS